MPAFAGSHLRRFEHFTERTADFADAGDVRDHVRLVVDPMEVDQPLRQERVRALHLMKRVATPAERPRGFRALEAVEPEVVRRLPFGCEQLTVELALELANRRSQPFELHERAGLGEVIDLVVVVLAAELRLGQRREVELLLVACVEPFIEPRRLARGLFSGRRAGLLRRGRGVAGAAGGEDHGQQ